MTTLAQPEPIQQQYSDDFALRDLIVDGRLRSVYQPIVCLDRGAPVGVEALLRGPVGTSLESPAALFGAAARQRLTGALDWASRRTALLNALDGGLAGPASLFLNAEPEGLRSNAFPGFDLVAERIADAGVQVVLEITERALTSHPAELLATVARIRELGWRLALDDVGAERASLALLPFLAPDIIKLDLRLVQQRTSVDVAEIVNAVLAHSERTGAAILAEGIETRQHLRLAQSMGARLGQGWYFGRPEPLSPTTRYVPLPLGTAVRPHAPATPWDLVTDPAAARTAAKPLLFALSRTLERQALAASEAAVVLGAFQREEFFTATTATRYGHLATSAAFVAALGEGIGTEPAPGVRGAALSPTDPLCNEWDVVVVGPHFAGALIARDLHIDDPVEGRLFSYILTYDRDRVLAAARSLMARVGYQLPAGGAF